MFFKKFSKGIFKTLLIVAITVIVAAHDDESGISIYEFSINDGEYIDNGNNNVYTFTKLTQNTNYNIKVRVTNGVNLTKEKVAIENIDIIEDVTDKNNGLYIDEYEDGRYFYKGANLNNHIEFNNEMWRILSVESDGSLKIIRNEIIKKNVFDSGNNNKWETLDIKAYLNQNYLETILTNKNKIISHTWSIGRIKLNNNDYLSAHITFENLTKSQKASVGMITVSEYLRANTNKEQCGSFTLNNDNYNTCKTTNWVYNIVPAENALWTILPYYDYNEDVFVIFGNKISAGKLGGTLAYESNGVSPMLYLKSDVILSGMGTEFDPFQIIN